MKQTKDKWSFILWNEAVGFSLLIVLSWLSEIFRMPHYLFRGAFYAGLEPGDLAHGGHHVDLGLGPCGDPAAAEAAALSGGIYPGVRLVPPGLWQRVNGCRWKNI